MRKLNELKGKKRSVRDSWSKRTLYLDICEYTSSVDIYYVEPDEDAIPAVEGNVQFTFIEDFCRYIENKYPKSIYILPDKYFNYLFKRNKAYPYHPISHAINLNYIEINKILCFRRERYVNGESHNGPSYPQYYLRSGYENPYEPIARDAMPYTGEEPHWIWRKKVRIRGQERPENIGKPLEQIQKEWQERQKELKNSRKIIGQKYISKSLA